MRAEHPQGRHEHHGAAPSLRLAVAHGVPYEVVEVRCEHCGKVLEQHQRRLSA